MARTRSRHPLLLGGLAIAVLGACQGPAPIVPATPAAVTGSGPASSPGAPVPPLPAAASRLAGSVELAGTPWAAADVSVRVLGQEARLAAGRTDAEGHFDLALPALAAGTPLEVVARLGERELMSLAAAQGAAAPFRVAAEAGALRLSWGSTVTVLALRPRLVAYGQLSAGTGAAGAEVLAAFAELARAIADVEAELLAAPASGTWREAVTAPGTDGLPRAVAQAVFSRNTTLRLRAYEAVRSLGTVLSRLVREGASTESVYLGPLTLGDQVYGAVFSSRGGERSGEVPADPNAGWQLEPATRAEGATPATVLPADRGLTQFREDALQSASLSEYNRSAFVGDGLWVFGMLRKAIRHAWSDAGWSKAQEATFSTQQYMGFGLARRPGSDHVYVLGGVDTGFQVLNQVQHGTFDGTSFTFETLTDVRLLKARTGASYEVVGDRLYVIGGSDQTGQPVATIETATFDGEGRLGAFSEVAGVTLGTPRWEHAGVVATLDGVPRYLVVAGGRTAGAVLDTVEIAPVDPVTFELGEFVSAGALATSGRRLCQAVQVGRALYVFGGTGSLTHYDEQVPMTDRAVLDPITGAPGGFKSHTVTFPPDQAYSTAVSDDRLVAITPSAFFSAFIR